MGMYRTKSQRILKKYLDAYVYGCYGYGPNETKRENIIDNCSNYAKRKKINKYVNKYIFNPDEKAKTSARILTNDN